MSARRSIENEGFSFAADEFWLAWWFSRAHADEEFIYQDTPRNQELALEVWRTFDPERIATAMESVGSQIRKRAAIRVSEETP